MHTFATPDQVLVRVSIAEGTVGVTATDARGDRCVEVDVQPLGSDTASREAADQTRVELVERNGVHEIVVDAPKRRLGLGRGVSIAVRITCPAETRLHVSTASADIMARGRLGDVDVKTASGGVDIDVVAGDLRAATASGDISVAEVVGTASIKTASGDASVGLSHGTVSMNVASGNLRLDRAFEGISAGTASGDVEIGEVESGEIKLQSVSGDVYVGVRKGLRVWIDASSVSGSISSELSAEDGASSSDGADVEIRARTVSGDVRIVSARRVPA
jgi:Putative adhesin